jgi:hypothetical protein
MTFKFCAVHLIKEQFDWVIATANKEGCTPSQVIGALIDKERRKFVMSTESQHSCEDVLYAFAVEKNTGRETIERYIQSYPQYANELIDLSLELLRGGCEDDGPLSQEDQALIDRAWQQHTEIIVSNKIQNTLSDEEMEKNK